MNWWCNHWLTRVKQALLQSLSFRDTALIEHVVPAVSHVTRGLIAQHEKSQVTVLAPVTRVVLGPKMADRLEAAKQASFTEYNEPVNSTAALVDELLDKLVYEFKYITNNAQLKASDACQVILSQLTALVDLHALRAVSHGEHWTPRNQTLEGMSRTLSDTCHSLPSATLESRALSVDRC